MDEVRKILELSTDSDKTAVLGPVQCELEYEFTQEQWALLQRYTNKLTITTTQVKME